jgi:serine/threonine protein kinase
MGCVPNRRKLGKDSAVEINSPNKKADSNNELLIKEVNSKKIKIERGMFIQGFSGNPYEKYDVVSELGEGAYGRVLKVKEKESEFFRAMKIIKKRVNYKKPEEEKLIKKEIHILRKLDHPNIIKVFEFYDSNNDFYIISELCEGGELFNRIIKLKKFTEKLAADVMKQLLSAVLFCHKNQIIHRDLKPENILIEANTTENSQDDEFFTIKVIDFGTAEIFKKDSLLSKQIGTPYYIAPEVLNNLYNEKCDMWSCGVIMYILLCGCPPFYGRNDQEIYASIKSGKFGFRQKVWESVSQEAKNLITKLLELDYNKRHTAEQAITDPWFALYDDAEEDCRQKTDSNEIYCSSKNKDNNVNSKNSDNNVNNNLNNKNNCNDENNNGIKSKENEVCGSSKKDFKSLYSNKINVLNNLNESRSSYKNNNKNNYIANTNIKVLNDFMQEKPTSQFNNDIILNNNKNNNNKNYKANGSGPNNLNIMPIKIKNNSSINELGLRDALTNLKNFKFERKLQLASLYFMVHTLITKEDVILIRELFNLFDTDRDGRLTKQEILRGVKSSKCMEFSENEIQNLMCLVDIDGNGYIEYQEFIAATYDKKKLLTEYNLKKAFELFDKDKNGKISSDELKTVLGVCNDENDVVWEKIISEIDSDGDGEISLDEFKTMMYNLVSSA